MNTVLILLIIIIMSLTYSVTSLYEGFMPANCTMQGYPGRFCVNAPSEHDLPPVCPPGNGITIGRGGLPMCLPYALDNSTWKPVSTVLGKMNHVSILSEYQ